MWICCLQVKHYEAIFFRISVISLFVAFQTKAAYFSANHTFRTNHSTYLAFQLIYGKSSISYPIKCWSAGVESHVTSFYLVFSNSQRRKVKPKRFLMTEMEGERTFPKNFKWCQAFSASCPDFEKC